MLLSEEQLAEIQSLWDTWESQGKQTPIAWGSVGYVALSNLGHLLFHIKELTVECNYYKQRHADCIAYVETKLDNAVAGGVRSLGEKNERIRILENDLFDKKYQIQGLKLEREEELKVLQEFWSPENSDLTVKEFREKFVKLTILPLQETT